MGCPCWPNKSQKITGEAANGTDSMPKSFKRSSNLGLLVPAFARLETSPLASAKNTGTPRREKLSARTLSVTVLPVPVAPAIKPCRFANCECKTISCVVSVVFLAITIGVLILHLFLISFELF